MSLKNNPSFRLSGKAFIESCCRQHQKISLKSLTSTPLILPFRESIYRLLPQTTPENLTKNFEQYTIDPVTRYPNLNSNCVRPHQVSYDVQKMGTVNCTPRNDMERGYWLIEVPVCQL